MFPNTKYLASAHTSELVISQCVNLYFRSPDLNAYTTNALFPLGQSAMDNRKFRTVCNILAFFHS